MKNKTIPRLPITDENWKALVRRYANGMTICNCGHAYYTNCGYAQISDVKAHCGYREVNDYPICDGGCSTAQLAAKEYVATQMLSGK